MYPWNEDARMTRRTVNTAAQAPHSWDIANWPPPVWPHDPQRARYIVRAFRDDLLRAGAVARVGRELVIIGDRYTRWLQLQAANVPGYESNANRSGERPVEPSAVA